MRLLVIPLLVIAALLPLPATAPIQSTCMMSTGPRVASSIQQVYGSDFSLNVFESVNEESYLGHVKKLTENGSRWTRLEGQSVILSDANVYAGSWIANTLEEISGGRIEVEMLGEHRSVLGRLPGWSSNRSAPVFVIGGHYDSVQNAPGANDDASGVAAVIELARVLSAYEWPLDIYFGAWNSEEIGLLGSEEVARILSQRHINILQYFNIDMLLVEDTTKPSDQRVWGIYNSAARFHESRLFVDLIRMMSHNYGMDLVCPRSSGMDSLWYHSDQYSFVQQGFKNALFMFESGFSRDNAYHRPADTWDNPLYNYSLGTDTTAAIGAAIAFTMSGAYDKPTSLRFSGTLNPGAEEKFLFVNSITTEVEVNATWAGGGLDFSVGAEYTSLNSSSFTQSSDWTQVLTAQTEWNGLHRVTVKNHGGEPVTFEMTVEYESDLNGNNIIDSSEYWMDSFFVTRDSDSDGLNNLLEKEIGTDPYKTDSDNDRMPDGYEYFNGLDPLVADGDLDPDGDGITNFYEYLNQTNPQSSDTDSDLMPDLWEIEHSLDPRTGDADRDPDGDSITNLQEYLRGSDPHSYDLYFLMLPGPASILLGGVIGAACVISIGIVVMRRRP